MRTAFLPLFPRKTSTSEPSPRTEIHSPQEDVNGEKLTVKKWWIFGADFSRFGADFFMVRCRFFTVYKGRKR